MGRRSLFPRRRRSSEGAIIGFLIVGAMAVAAAGVYLLAVGAVAFISWVAKVVVQETRARRAVPHIASATGPSHAPPPQQEFFEITRVDKNAFANPEKTEAAVGSVFAAWAGMIPKVPKDPRQLITGMQIRDRMIGRLTTRLEGRRVVLRCASYSGRQRVGEPRVDPTTIDAWSPPRNLREESRYIASCATCHGEGRVDCRECLGIGRTTCVECRGAGRYIRAAANGVERLLNCPRCRGKGDVTCAGCVRGRVNCPVCDKTKRVECWLEVDTSAREDVQVEPDGQITRAFRWGKDGVSAERTEIELDAHVVYEISQSRRLTHPEVQAGVPEDWLAQHGSAIQPSLQSGERIQAQTFVLLSVPSVEVTYATGAEQASVEFHGLRLLAPPAIAEGLLHQRSRSLDRMWIALAAVPLIASVVYAFRGGYFLSGAVVAAVAASAACAALIYVAMWNATLGRRSARKWFGASVMPAMVAVVLAIVAEPSEAAARDLINDGNLHAARSELQALDSESASQKALWDELFLREARAAASLDDARALATRISEGTPQAAAARAHIDGLLSASAEKALTQEQLDIAQARLAEVSPGARGSAQVRSLMQRLAEAQGQKCLANKAWKCAMKAATQAESVGAPAVAVRLRNAAVAGQRAAVDDAIRAATSVKLLEQRVNAQQAAVAAWTTYAAMVPESEPESAGIAAIRAQHTKDLALLEKQRAAERKTREAEERRAAQRRAAEEKRAALAEAREQRRIEAAERREALANRSLVCNDGSTSPSCTCGGSWTGCCSRHGGVRGCERLEEE